MRALLAAALFSLSLAACAPPDEPPPAGGGDGGGDGGGGDDGSGGGTSGGDATPTLALSVDPAGGHGASRLDLEMVGLGVFTGADPSYVDADTRCDGDGAGTLLELRKTVPLDLAGGVEAPLASLDLTAGGAVRELWLVLRQGLLARGARTYKVHAGTMCVMPDGLQYIVVRLRPGSAIPLDGDHRVVATLDAARDVVVERVRCGGGADDEECASSEDDDDDGDSGTRLRYSFAPTLPVRVDPS